MQYNDHNSPREGRQDGYGEQTPGYGLRGPNSPGEDPGQSRRAVPPRYGTQRSGGTPGGYGQENSPRQPNRANSTPRRSGNPSAGGQGRASRRRAPEPPKSGGGRWFRALLMVLATIGACVFFAIFILGSAFDFTGMNQEDRDIVVIVPEGSSTKDVANLLRDAGVVESPLAFRIYAGIKTNEGDFLPGRYVFNANLSYNELFLYLKRGDSEKEEVRLTFREGRTVVEIANLLEEYKVCDAEEFLEYLETADYDYQFFNALPEEEFRFRRLEGYIFPDTYDFFVGENVADVARKFLRNFNDKMDGDIQAQMQERGLSVDETIILASIIQKEAGTEEDMVKVSSAFYNRLALPQAYPKLQSDVTIFYVNNNIKPYLEQTNQEMYDAYNTYVCNGLPIGPICNPGMDAIKAALNPANTEYYYFVTDKNEEFYYAKTFEEHEENVALAQAEGGEAHGIATQE